MAIPISVSKLIDGGVVEQARIEYKQGWNPEAIVHTVCAFANDIDNWGGGYIVVGVEEKNGIPVKPVKGLSASSLDAIQKDMLVIGHKIHPCYMPVCEPVTYEGKHLFLIWVPGGYDRPYQGRVSLSGRNTEMAYYVRRYSSTVKASQADIRELHELGGNIPFDDRVNNGASLSDLRMQRMIDFFESVGSHLREVKELTLGQTASALRVVGGPSESQKPLNVGLMFFSDDPAYFLREARIEIVEIPDPTGEGMTERRFSGPLNIQLSDALLFIQNNVIAEKVTKVHDRAEAIRVVNYPYQAIEEALSNAVYHKSYQIPEPITIRVEPDKLTITSFPGPDRSISDENLKDNKLVVRRYRNRRIGDFLKELRLVEGRNTGVPTMLRSLSANGSPPPLFESDEERSFFAVTFRIHDSFISDEELVDKQEKINKRRSRAQLRIDILSKLESGSYSQNELSRLLGYSGISKTFTEVVREMVESGQIRYTTDSEKDPEAKLKKVES